MTDQEIVDLGTYAEELMGTHEFCVLVSLFETQTTQHILNTTASEKDVREQAHADYRGLKAFLGVITSVVERKNRIIAVNEAPSDDVPEEDIVD